MRLEALAADHTAPDAWLARVSGPLLAALQQAPALWVGAPAGCGKTQVCAALAARRGAGLRVWLGPGDTLPALRAALARHAAAASAATWVLEGVDTLAAPPTDAHQRANDGANDGANGGENDGADGWTALLAQLQTDPAPPAGRRLVLVSRRAPPPALAPLRLAGQLRLAPSRMADWCWSADEMAAAWPDAPGALAAATGGWPVAAAALAACGVAARPRDLHQADAWLPLLQWAGSLWQPGTPDDLLPWLATRLPALPLAVLQALPAAEGCGLDHWQGRALLWPPALTGQPWMVNPLAAAALGQSAVAGDAFAANPARAAGLAQVLQALQTHGHDALAVDLLLDLGHTAAAAALLARLAPDWYRAARHADLRTRSRRLPRAEVGPQLALWEALATWYVDPTDALLLLRTLARGRGLLPGAPPATEPARLGEDLFVLAALLRSELALLAGADRLQAVAGMIDERLQAAAAAETPVLSRLGAHSALLFHHSLFGDVAGALAVHTRAAQALIPQLADRHSLCSTVPLARWPLLRGDMATARETTELVAVGLLAGDDAAMPIAHAWLMEMLQALAAPGALGPLHDWVDGGTDRGLSLASPIAPTLLSTLALLEARAPPGTDAGVQALALPQQERWSPFERWFVLAARTWRHLRDGDLPAARAVLALLRALPVPAPSLLAASADLLGWQIDAAAGQPLSAELLLAQARRWADQAWPGPALLARLLAIGAGAPADAQALDAAWRQQALSLPLFCAPGTVRAAMAAVRASAPGSAWLAAAEQALAGARADAMCRAPRVCIRLQHGLAVELDGQALPFGRKPPRKLLELLALLALQAPRELPRQRLADLLYPDLDGDAARRALDTALYRLRRLLPDGAVQSGHAGVRFDPAQVQVDTGDAPAALLPEFDQPWAEAARRSRPPLAPK